MNNSSHADQLKRWAEPIIDDGWELITTEAPGMDGCDLIIRC
jgi:hypothetical protein